MDFDAIIRAMKKKGGTTTPKSQPKVTEKKAVTSPTKTIIKKPIKAKEELKAVEPEKV